MYLKGAWLKMKKSITAETRSQARFGEEVFSHPGCKFYAS